MRRTLAALAMGASVALSGAGAQAQTIQSYCNCGQYYAVPGQSMRIYPPPRYIYRMGSMTVYSNGNYGYPWPYDWGYSRTWIYYPPYRPGRPWPWRELRR